MWMAQVPAALAVWAAMAVQATASVSVAVRMALAALVAAMAVSGESGSGGPWWRGIGAGPASDFRLA